MPLTATDKFRTATAEEEKLLEKVINDNTELHPLKGFNILLVFRNKLKKRGEAIILGEASRYGEMDSLLHDYNARVLLCETSWDEMPHIREALLFHELMHFEVTDDGEIKMRGHDLEEFGAVVRKYGAWKSDVADFLRQSNKAMQADPDAVTVG